ncbi:MAG: patatin-like phospholipase family protein [Bacilli bacterium]|nr:patatin-like phospholipase family protein [Bacilli bacterium]
MKKALVLQGGGAKGAYAAGAIKALTQKRIYFDFACGTSIGAINAALYVNKKLDAMYKLWLNTDYDEIFGLDCQIFSNFSKGIFKKKDIKSGFESLTKIIKNDGIDTTKMMKFLEKNIKEDAFRKSNIDFGLNTYNLSDMKPVEIYKKDIPEGKLHEYLMSSAFLPFFKFEKLIDGKYYVDGGVYSDCPIDMAIEAGYKEIYVIKAWLGKVKYTHKKDVKVHVIGPRESLGSIMSFTKKDSEMRMKLGYYDTLKYLYKLDGNKYYFKKYSETYYKKLFTPSVYKKIIKEYDKGIIPKTDKDFIIKIIEKACKECDIERFKIYNMPFLLTRLKYKMITKPNSKYYYFIKNIKVEFD